MWPLDMLGTLGDYTRDYNEIQAHHLDDAFPQLDGCAPGRIRTCDTRFRKPMLYPLSYEGLPAVCRQTHSLNACLTTKVTASAAVDDSRGSSYRGEDE
jgi:hypothetical protein